MTGESRSLGLAELATTAFSNPEDPQRNHADNRRTDAAITVSAVGDSAASAYAVSIGSNEGQSPRVFPGDAFFVAVFGYLPGSIARASFHREHGYSPQLLRWQRLPEFKSRRQFHRSVRPWRCLSSLSLVGYVRASDCHEEGGDSTDLCAR